MSQQPKRWVFSELVKDPNDPEQLIAYAMYKGDKDELAVKSRQERGLSEAQIEKELQQFHDHIVISPGRLQSYRDKAQAMVDELTTRVSNRVDLSYADRIKKLEQDIWLKWGERASDYSDHLQKPGFGKKVGRWLVSGVPGLLATVVTTVIIVGGFALLSDEPTAVARKGIDKALDTMLPRHGVDLPLGDEPSANKSESKL
ncbi:hypothetical protein [Pectobacterium brasiliense]|uniref:hypothetical protein n=1 Tax=Pectobacterium brasiliense TaxID=180957 RepID=UPI00068AF0AD|nr:hypothetical protein [Pectobacterium brasiliense]